jgi:hypothetical protein
MQHLVGLHDSYYLVTPYTILYAASGTAMAWATDSAAAVVTVVAARLLFARWAGPAIGYGSSRNTGNTAMDVAVGMGAFAVTKGHPLAEGAQAAAIAGLCTGALLKWYPGTLPDSYPTPAPSRVLQWVRRTRNSLRCCIHDTAATMFYTREEQREHSTSPTTIGMDYTYESFMWPHALEQYQPMTRAHWALAVAYVAIALAGPWRDVPSLLACFSVPYALCQPSLALVKEQDNKTEEVIANIAIWNYDSDIIM